MGFWTKHRSKSQAPDDWFRNAVRFYRRMGFFEEHKGLAEDDLITALKGVAETTSWDSEFPKPTDPFPDAEVMQLDPDRVWWQDLEADVCMENHVYKEELPVLAQISRGAFSAEDIVETWAGEKGPVIIEFTSDGVRHRIDTAYNEDWMTEGFFEGLKTMMHASPYRLYTFDTRGQDLFLVALTDEEAKTIRRERGFRLEPL